MRRIAATATAIVAIPLVSICLGSAANAADDSGSFDLQFPGETVSIPYSAVAPYDLEIVLEDSGAPDDEVNIEIDGCYITTLYQDVGGVSAVVSLSPGIYSVDFIMVENALGSPSPFTYSLTENPYTGDYVNPCLNQPPVADAGDDQIEEQTSHAGADILLDGSGSYDPEGLPLTYDWTWDGEWATGVNPVVTLPLGATTVTLTVTDDFGEIDTDTVDIEVIDTTPPVADCRETENPHGRRVPPARPKHVRNPDGFYLLTATDICDSAPDIYVLDTGSGTLFGPFPSGVEIKYTVDPDAVPEMKTIGSNKGRAGDTDWHIIGKGGAEVFAVDLSGNQSAVVVCH